MCRFDPVTYIRRTPGYFFEDIQWTAKRHIIASQKLYKFIVTGNLIPNDILF
jgi:hypothetical protein